MGGSILAQVTQQVGDTVRPTWTIGGRPQRLFQRDPGAEPAKARLLAYHDRSDGGLWATLCEMAFAGRGCVGERRHAGLEGEPRIRLRRRQELGRSRPGERRNDRTLKRACSTKNSAP
jgi:phosphoribosylformylglycinamidine synthase